MPEKRTRAFRARKQHAARRAYQRHGIELTTEDYVSLGNQIAKQRATRVRKLTNTRAEYIVNYHGEPLTVIYSHQTKQIVTVLPKENL